MAKKSIEGSNLSTKSIDEMSDIEFITSADYLASPYYRAYVSAKARIESGNYQPLSKRYDLPSSSKGRNSQSTAYAKPIKGAVYSKKRGITQFFIMLFMLIILAVAVVGFFNIANIDSYVAIYIEPGVTEETNINIGLLDPVLGIVKKIASVDVDSFYYDNYMSNISDNVDIMTKVSLYAVPVAALLIIICALIGFFKAIVALCSKKHLNGMYKKYKFGFLSIVMLLCALILVVGGIFASGMEIAAILDFVLLNSTVLYAGYGLYAVVILPMLMFLLSCGSYKKAKE
ncbi:MAG TPA: hypothetical protein VJ903_02530 [Clostridia bacterium]|nr:hypothetical protein [Clostridia bacterium]